MNNSKLITVVIPCYNSEEYIENMINMLKTANNIDVVFVDDCSTDNTYLKIQNLIKNFSNMNLYKTEKNGGPGVARNIGILNVKTKYIMFIDSDDKINNKVFDFLGNIKLDKDLYVFPLIHESKFKKFSTINVNITEKSIDDDLLELIKTGYVYSKLYLKEIIVDNNLFFNNRMLGEDVCFFINYLTYVKDYKFINFPYYTYKKNPSSITHKYRENLNLISIFDELESKFKEYFKSSIYELFALFHLLNNVKIMVSNKVKIKTIRKFLKIENKRYPDWYKNIDLKKQNIYRKLCLFFLSKNMAFSIFIILKIRSILY